MRARCLLSIHKHQPDCRAPPAGTMSRPAISTPTPGLKALHLIT